MKNPLFVNRTMGISVKNKHRWGEGVNVHMFCPFNALKTSSRRANKEAWRERVQKFRDVLINIACKGAD